MAASTGTSEQSSEDSASLRDWTGTCGPTIQVVSNDLTDRKKDRVHGMLVGVMLGDTLGHAHEFRYQTDVYTGKLQYKPKHQSRWQGTKYAVIGQYTDDTEMTLALAQSLVRMKRYDRDDVILSYQHWANTNATGMGVNTRSLFKNVKTVKGFESRYVKGMKGELSGAKSPLTDARSNGSLMRCSPLSLLEGYDAVIQDVNLTNPTVVNQDCAILYITTLRFLHQGHLPIPIYNTIKKMAQTPEAKEVFQQIDDFKTRDILVLKGYVIHSFYCAMLTLVTMGTSLGERRREGVSNGDHESSTYAEMIDNIIRMGGDTDTNAAIAGAVIGSYYGFDKIMLEPITKENYDIIISMDPSEGDCPVDDRYMPARVEEVANALSEIFT